MHMHGNYNSWQRVEAARERGRRMARVRWDREREQRARWAAAEPLAQVAMGRVLVQRVIVIQQDQTAVELCRWSDTTAREWTRMKKEVRL